jgi:beta-lactamase regulating signal transducer with metallopeptidase domain
MALELVSEILLPRLLAATVQSTLFVAVVWALCRALPRLSAAARAGLWWLVALQLVVGVVWSSPLALPLLPAEVVEHVQLEPVRAAPVNVTALSFPASDAFASTPAALAQPALQWSWSTALAVLWLLGLAFMIARTLRGYLATRRLLDESRPCKDAVLLGALRLAAEAHGLREPPRLRLSASIDSPQLIGPWHPVLLLPATPSHSMHADELDMALTHELVHLQRNDLWWGLLPAAAQHLFFFHPLAHLAAHEYALAREAACDAAVIAGNRHCAHDYGRLLVRLGVAPRPSAGLASASPTFRILKRRLLMLQNTATTPRVVALLLTVAVAALGVVPYRIVAAPHAGTAAPVAQATTPKAGEPAELAPLAETAELAEWGTPLATTAPVAAVSLGSAAYEMAPPPPPPPAPAAPEPTPPVPAVPMPAPPAPAAAPTPSAVPAPPAPPAPVMGMTTRGVLTLASNNDQAYVLLQGNASLMNASMGDMAEARRQQRNGEELLWFRKGRASYVVRDPAVLARMRSAFEETIALADAQGRLGDRQGELGDQQGKLGERQGEIGMRQAELAVSRENSEHQAALAAQQRGMAEQAQFLAERQAVMAREQAKLAEKQAAASARTQREVKKLIDEALAKGFAQQTKG